MKYENLITEKGLFRCPYCGTTRNKYGIGHHIWRNHTEEGKRFTTKGRVAWNKGKKNPIFSEYLRNKWKNNKKFILSISKNNTCRHKFTKEESIKGGTNSLKKRWNNDREKMMNIVQKGIESSMNSWRRIPNRIGQKMRSPLEVKVSHLFLDNNIKYEFEKTILGKYPDFYLKDKNLIIEIAGVHKHTYLKELSKKCRLFIQNEYNLIVYNQTIYELDDDIKKYEVKNDDELLKMIMMK